MIKYSVPDLGGKAKRDTCPGHHYDGEQYEKIFTLFLSD